MKHALTEINEARIQAVLATAIRKDRVLANITTNVTETPISTPRRAEVLKIRWLFM